MKILVTGASGFVGGYLIQELVEHNHQVVGTIRKSSNASDLEKRGVVLREMDLEKPESVKRCCQDIDVIIHLAAYYTFHGKKTLYRKINVEGTKLLLDAALENGVSRFIYCSSTEAMGPVVNPPGDENSACNPEYEYGRSKKEAEDVVMQYGNKGIDYTIIRASGMYGPHNINDVSYYTIVSFCKNAFVTKFIVGSGNNLIQFVHVRDVARALRLSAEAPLSSKNQIFIVSDERAYSYNDVYAILANLCGRNPPRHHFPSTLVKLLIAPIEGFNRLFGRENFMLHISTVKSITTDRAYSIEKAKKLLGYRPAYDLKEGLAETIDWYKSNGYL